MNKKQQQDACSKLIRVFSNALAELGAGQPELSINTVIVFLEVAQGELRGEPLDGVALSNRTGLSPSAISRNLGALGEYHRLRATGLGLVEYEAERTNRRRKIATLTTKGSGVFTRLIESIN